MTDRPGAVVVGGHVNGLAILRSLARRGVATAVVTTMPYDIAHLSRWSEERVECPATGGCAGLLALLRDRRDRWRGRVVFPTTDPAVEVLSRHREELAESYRLFTPSWDAVRPLLHKDEFGRVAAAVGVATPRVLGSVSKALCADPDLELPALVKPTRSQAFRDRFGVKLFAVETAEELERALTLLRQAGLDGELVEWIPGPDSEMFDCHVYIDVRGRLVGHVEFRRLRNGPPFFGITRAARTAAVPELLSATLSLLSSLGYTGIANSQFKRDAGGHYRLLEINARSAHATGLAVAAGVDLPWLAYRDLVAGDVAPVTADPRPRSWFHLHADLLYWLLLRELDGCRLGDVLRAPPGGRHEAVWSLADPRPFLGEWLLSARGAL
ncbi:MAG: ATP-grasp domain-containing protein, partial [Thermoanaerobaculia bacterium]|nr:ATP-grasp domain-containing protein [Thermoanaerobaculia bacterium]